MQISSPRILDDLGCIRDFLKEKLDTAGKSRDSLFLKGMDALHESLVQGINGFKAQGPEPMTPQVEEISDDSGGVSVPSPIASEGDDARKVLLAELPSWARLLEAESVTTASSSEPVQNEPARQDEPNPPPFEPRPEGEREFLLDYGFELLCLEKTGKLCRDLVPTRLRVEKSRASPTVEPSVPIPQIQRRTRHAKTLG